MRNTRRGWGLLVGLALLATLSCSCSRSEFAARIVTAHDDEICVQRVDELGSDSCLRVHESDPSAGLRGKDPKWYAGHEGECFKMTLAAGTLGWEFRDGPVECPDLLRSPSVPS